MSVLHALGDLLRNMFLQVPLWGARALFLAVLLGLMIWVVQLPKSATAPSASSPWHEDLRIWAWVALMLQLLAYGLL